jgi:hypothetical protein
MKGRGSKVFGVVLLVLAAVSAILLVGRSPPAKIEIEAGAPPKTPSVARAKRLVPQVCDQMGLSDAEKEQVLQIMITRGYAIDEGARIAREDPKFQEAGRDARLPPPSKAQQDEARAQIKALLGEERTRQFYELFFRAEMAERGVVMPSFMHSGPVLPTGLRHPSEEAGTP